MSVADDGWLGSAQKRAIRRTLDQIARPVLVANLGTYLADITIAAWTDDIDKALPHERATS